MNTCSSEISIPCRCEPDAPSVGMPTYAERRTHPDAGDLQALRLITNWIDNKYPTIHLRFADGEFWSILKRKGVNTDGAAFAGDTLGIALHNALLSMASGALHGKHALIGGDWSISEHKEYIQKNNLFRTIPWCPSSIWVNGVVSGLLAVFFEVLANDSRPKILIANSRIAGAAKFLRSMFFEISATNAWGQRDQVAAFLRHAPEGAVVLYCAGMASEGFAWSAFRERPDLTQLDMGHVFDGAFGIRNRCWLLPEGECLRRDVYFDRYAPVFRGEKASFGNF